MTNSRTLVLLASLSASLALFACASLPKVDLPAGTNPQQKLTETDARLRTDLAKQYDQLSPAHFRAAHQALKQAHQRSEKAEPSEKILADIGQAMAHLDVVEENGQKNAPVLASVLTARTAARSVKAEEGLPEQFNSTDRELQSLGSDIENHEFQPVAADLSKLENRYYGLELMALKNNHLGEARSLIEKAIQNEAAEKAPLSLSAAQVQYESAARSIEANRRNAPAYQPVVAQSVKSARKLDQVLKTVIDSKSSESAAIQIYDQNQQLAKNQTSLQNADQQALAARTQGETDRQSIQALQGQNQEYADREALNQNIERIKGQFTPAEAEVVRDGSKIIIRLKSMKFSSARFEFTSSSLDTLQKVKEMIGAVTVAKVVVEGHTDSVGAEKANLELSQKRAEAIKKYFVAEKTLDEDKVEAKGFGYERPLTTNKTSAGRATNRRVDVVIETASI